MSETIKPSQIAAVANVAALSVLGLTSDGSFGRFSGARVLSYMGEATDANLCTTLGIWNLQSSAANIPANTFRNVLLVLPYTLNNTGAATCTQILFTHAAGREKIYRRAQLNEEFTSWKEIAMVS